MFRRILLTAAAVGFSATAAFAGPPAAIGADSGIASWGLPGVAMNGPTSGLYSLTTTLTAQSQWKILKDGAAGWGGGNEIGDTGGGNLSTALTAAGATTFYYRPANAVGEPATHSVSTDVASTLVWVAVGGFQGDFGGSDWDPDSAATELNDTGANGDLVAGDKIFSRKVTATAGATGEIWKLVSKGFGAAWSGELKLGPNGWSQDPGDSSNQTVPTYVAGDVLYFAFDAIAGTIFVAKQPADVADWSLMQ